MASQPDHVGNDTDGHVTRGVVDEDGVLLGTPRHCDSVVGMFLYSFGIRLCLQVSGGCLS